MHRFFCPQLDTSLKSVQIDDPTEVHHIKNVLRLKEGSTLQIFDGKEYEAQGIINKLSTTSIEINVQKIIPSNKPQCHIVLACAIPKKAKFETIIEKCTELGVDEIIPIQTKRTEVKVPENKLLAKQDRYQKIALNAAKQSQRTTVPKIHPPTKFEDVINQITKNTTAFIPCLEDAGRISLSDAFGKIKSPKHITFFVGPEGDFTPNEINYAKNAGCIPISLGPLVLKVDTAAITIVSFASLNFNA